MKSSKFITSFLAVLMFVVSIATGLLIEDCLAGECMQSRQEMLDAYNKAIANIIENPNADYYSPGIVHCWYHWDPNYPNGELNEELGEAILFTLRHQNIEEYVKTESLEIACSAAPGNLFHEMIRLLKEKEGDQRDLVFRAILEIWKYNAHKDKNIANYNYIKLFKNVLPEEFTPPFKDKVFISMTSNDYWLRNFYIAMGKVYSFGYLKAKKILIENDLFYPSNCNCYFGYIFRDPRAFEDSNYQAHNHKSSLFYSLLRHLELEFKIEWLQKIEPHQLRLLRNGIIATYGWEFKDRKLKNWFNACLAKIVCRNGICGKVNDRFDGTLLTDIDKKNLALIKKLEQ